MEKIVAALKTIFNFITDKWIIILFILSIIALCMLLSITLSFIKERNRSDRILTQKAYAEYELAQLKLDGDRVVPFNHPSDKNKGVKNEEEIDHFHQDFSAFD